MDLETENRIAAVLIEEARKMRMQAEKEGIQAYLCQPSVRARPNSRFLTATVLGVQQANRAVEVNEMWRAREKELELQNAHKNNGDSLKGSSSSRIEHEKRNHGASCSSRNPDRSDYYSGEDRSGLQDDEIEQFLRSRVKRGRGDIGSRMDEPGPYLPSTHHGDSSNLRVVDKQERKILGPEKLLFLKSSSPEKSRKENSSSRDKKKKKTEKHRKKKTKRREERLKHRHKSRRSE